MSTAAQVFDDYLSAFTSGDMESAGSLISEDFSFLGFLDTSGGQGIFFSPEFQVEKTVRNAAGAHRFRCSTGNRFLHVP